MNKELVSIITPVYNSAKYIEQTITSVQNQTFENWEMICVDDCSIDNSISVIEKKQKEDSRIKLIQLTSNMGAAVARNTAIEKAQGRYIAFLDADDLWMPAKLEKQISFVQKHKIGLCYSSYFIFKNDKVNIGYKIPVIKNTTYHSMLRNNFIGCLTVLLDRKQIDIPIEMPNVRKRQDYLLWLYLLKNGVVAKGMNEVLSLYRIADNSLSADKKSAAKYNWQLLRKHEQQSLFNSVFYFSYYAIYNVLKRIKLNTNATFTSLSEVLAS